MDELEDFEKVAKVGDVPQDKGLAVIVGKRPAALFFVNGEYFAIKDICPHLGAAMHQGFILENNVVACADHGWTFSLETGLSPHREDCSLPCYDVKVIGDDIYVSRKYRERMDGP